jgi:hypothetical protein
MPSARELLEQADALMRRNRSRETTSPAMGPRTMAPTLARKTVTAPGDFPVLTEAVGTASVMPPPRATIGPAIAESAPHASPPVAPPPAVTDPLPRTTSAPAAAVSAAALVSSAPVARVAAARVSPEVPVLTDAIAEIDAALDAALSAAAREGEPSIWNDEAMQGDDSVLGPAPKSIAVIPEHPHIPAEPPARDAVAEAEAARAIAASTDELIEEVRLQVLQRIDMFTDTGLREQLGERLKPIVDRASAELVATINQQVGELLRTYVAEAIERELDRLRKDVH